MKTLDSRKGGASRCPCWEADKEEGVGVRKK